MFKLATNWKEYAGIEWRQASDFGFISRYG